MKHVVSYSELVLNTILDTMKRENRTTVDTTDIMNFENVVVEVAKENNFFIEIEDLTSRNKFNNEVNEFVCRLEDNGEQIYSLLPWISEEELENKLKNTIFRDNSLLYNVTSTVLNDARNINDIRYLKDIENYVARLYLKETMTNISSIEKEKQNEEIKLQKIKSRLNREY